MTKKLAGLLLCMALLFTVVASADTTTTVGCGSAGATAPPQPGPPLPPFTPGLSAVALAGCPVFTIPAGQTLTSVRLTFKNDWQLGAGGGTDNLVFTYTINGYNIGSMVSAVTGTSAGSVVPVSTNVGTCAASGDEDTCNDPISIVGPGTFNAIAITVTATWTSGGLDFSGSLGTTVNAIYTTTPTPPPPVCPTFQVSYAANLNVGDSVINITNGGTQNSGGALTNICANVYAFSPDEQLISCCSCPVTPNALVSLSAVGDLISNTLTPARPNSIVMKIAATSGTTCNASNVPAANLAAGLVAWGTTLHATPAGTYAVTEFPFSNECLSPAELARITSFCGFIQADGSGFGICRSCRLGGQGATKQ